jgi:type VI secretion system secreted protein VgrG
MSELAPNATYHLDTESFAGKVVIERVHIEEALDETYRAELEIVVEQEDADVTQLLGQNCVIRIERTPLERKLCGLIHEVHEGIGDERARAHARIVVAPALALLRLRRNTRMFQEKTVPEILEAVLNDGLGPYSREISVELEETYEAREYCLQYQESDLDFVHRLMEEEGIGYTFTHDGDKEVLVLFDKNETCPVLETFPPGGLLELHATNLNIADKEPILQFHRYHRPTTTSVVIRDHEWTRSELYVEGEERGLDELGVDREVYEHGLDRKLAIGGYDAGARKYQKEDSAGQAKIRREAHVGRALVGFGSSRVVCMRPGTTFEVASHPDMPLVGRYLLTKVVQSGHCEPGADAAGTVYENLFECIPAHIAHRPVRRTPRPTIEGIQTAVVTGPSGEEIHVDEHGRIKVQFHWDRENPADETSSCWVRVKQEWAGSGWGFWWVPRMGMEVVVHFIDGDPDRPLVTGAVYNANNALPYALPDEKTKSTIKSNKSIGGGGFNELRFEDKAGSEEIYTHAQKDYNEVVEHDHNTLVHANQTNEVDGDQDQTVHGNQDERVDGTQDMSVGGNRTVHVEGNFDEKVDGTETRHVAGAVSETFGASETRSIAADVTEDISASETRTISAAQSETITGSRTQTISGSGTQTIGAALTETVTGGITQLTTASYTLTAVGGNTINTPASLVWTALGGMTCISPGGMIRTDFEWKTNADKNAVSTGFAYETYITKSEAYGFAYAGGVLRVAVGSGHEVCVTACVQRGLEARANGTWKNTAGLWNRLRLTLKA